MGNDTRVRALVRNANKQVDPSAYLNALAVTAVNEILTNSSSITAVSADGTEAKYTFQSGDNPVEMIELALQVIDDGSIVSSSTQPDYNYLEL